MEELLDELLMELNIATDNFEEIDIAERTLKRTVRQILDRTRREYIEDGMYGIVLDLAIINFNRRGTEGESNRTEGGITTAFYIPHDIEARLRIWRVSGFRMV